MFNYLRAEFYRITHKRSVYIYYATLFASVLGLFFISSGGTSVDQEDLFQVGMVLLQNFSFIFFGVQIFITVYGDDFSGRYLASTISSGISQVVIIVSKIIIALVYYVIVYLAALVVFEFMSLIATGSLMSLNHLNQLVIVALIMMIGSLVYMSVAAIFLYWSSKSTLAIVTYIFLLMGISIQILTLISYIPLLSWIGNITEYLFNTVFQLEAYQFSYSGISSQFLLTGALYLGISLLVSIFIAKKLDVKVD